jgi:hypothetical protein
MENSSAPYLRRKQLLAFTDQPDQKQDAEFDEIWYGREQSEKVLPRAARPEHEGDAEQQNELRDAYEHGHAQLLGGEE